MLINPINASLKSALLRNAFFAVSLAAGLFAGAAAKAQTGMQVELTSAGIGISQLLVGEDLEVELGGATAGTTYDLRLSSSQGQLIAGAYAIADAAGKAGARIWVRSGLVGCDAGAAADPAAFRFATFPEAEQQLAGETLRLAVLTLAGVEVAEVFLPVAARSGEIRYFSDAAGCPRWDFAAGETMYLSFLRADHSRPHRRIYLVAAFAGLGQPFEDVRGTSQAAELPALGELITLPVEGSSQVAGGTYEGRVVDDFQASLTSGWGEAAFDASPLAGNPDSLSEEEQEGTGGIVITVDGCPTCGGTTYP